jgi:hypothetical protein
MVSLRTALANAPFWIIDVKPSGDIGRAWEYGPGNLPFDAIPEADVLLTPELEEELAADSKLAKFAESKTDGEMVFDGAPVDGRHTIDFGFYGSFCHAARSLWDEICQKLNVDAVPLRLGMASPSSYAVNILVPDPIADGDMFADPKENEAERLYAFDCFMSLLSNDQSAYAATMLVKMNPAVRHELANVLDLVSKASGDLSVRTITHPRLRTLTSRGAEDRLTEIKNLRLTVIGELLGGFVEKVARHDIFGISCNLADQDPEQFFGKTEPIAANKMRGIPLGSTVRATLRVHHNQREQTYTLENIERAEGDVHMFR